MNTLIKFRSFLLAAFAFCLFPSCDKYLDIGSPTDQLGIEDGFVDSLAAVSSISSVYGYYYTTGGNEFIMNINRVGAMSADEGYYTANASNTYLDDFANNTLAVGNNTAQAVFAMPYYILHIVNSNLEGLAMATHLSQSLRDQLSGEMKFWRAYLNFYLVNYFGDIPLVTTANSLDNARTPRTPAAEVWSQISADLADAKTLLKEEYPSVERARVNLWAATALEARVFLHRNMLNEAAVAASEVIGQQTYTLEPDLNNVFIRTSREVIWQNSNTNGVTRMGTAFIPSGATPTFVLRDTLINTFEVGDKRKENWTRELEFNTITYRYPFKYKVRSGSGNEYSVMLRLAEQYLIRAEALAETGDLSGAIADVDAVRARAGLPLISETNPSISAAELLNVIDHERWVELFTEGSDRWFNLKRRGNPGAILSLIKPLWQDFQALYPIPLTAIQSNVSLTQNIGYER